MSQRVVITGATGGIGQALSHKLAEKGFELLLTGRSQKKLSELAESLPQDQVALTQSADLTNPEQVHQFFEKAAPFDAVVHLAGQGLIKPLADTTDAEFLRVSNINVRGTFLVAQHACRIMAEAKRGRFLTVPGILGKAVMKNASVYIATKFAVTGFIKALAQEYQRQGIHFGLYHLGGVDTPFWDDLGMGVQRDKMISAETAAEALCWGLEMPAHLALNEVTFQPESHQLPI